MSTVRIKIVAEKQLSMNLDLEELLHEVNSIAPEHRIPFVLQMINGLTDNDIRYLPASVKRTLMMELEDKIKKIKQL